MAALPTSVHALRASLTGAQPRGTLKTVYSAEIATFSASGSADSNGHSKKMRARRSSRRAKLQRARAADACNMFIVETKW